MRAHRCGKTATKKPNRSKTVGQPCKIRPWKQDVEIAIFWRYNKEKRLWHLFCHSLLVAETGLEPATSGLWEIQNLCVTVLFCWVWWCCVPRLGIDFVPCVQKSAASCWPVPNPFGGSFGGKSVRRILTRNAQINAQLWSHWEIETTDLTRFSRRKSHTNQHTIFTLVSGNPTGNSDFFFLRESTNSCLKTVFVFTYQPSLGCGVACWILTIHMFLTDFS